VREFGDANQFPRAIEARKHTHPGKYRDVGDGVGVPHHPGTPGEPLIQHAKQPLGFCDVSITRPLVLEILAGEFMEEADLAEHRADATHLEHHPLNRFIASRAFLREKLTRLVCQIDEDRP